MRNLSGLSRCAVAFVLAAVVTAAAVAQTDTAPDVGIRDVTPRVHALVDVTVHVAPGEVIEGATIVVRDGRIEAVGDDVAAPDDARVWSLGGHTVFAGLVDPYSQAGLPASLKPREPAPSQADGPPQPTPRPPVTATGFWNPHVHSELDVATMLEADEDTVGKYRNAGFGAVLSAPRRGVLRGQSALISLADGAALRDVVITPRVGQHGSFELSGGFPGGDYPTSLMGAIALLRQTFYDAQWYRDARVFELSNPAVERAAENAALAALERAVEREQRVFFVSDDELDYARVGRIVEEFGLRGVLIGNGYEYRQANLLDQLDLPVIVPLAFPDPPSVESPDAALEVSLEALEHWELAPSNAAYLAQAGVEFSFTADGIDDLDKEFWSHVRRAIERGLPPEDALAALTTRPAALLGESERLGTVEPGRIGNLVVADSDPFTDEDAEIELVFVDGVPYELTAYRKPDIEGRWRATLSDRSVEFQIRDASGRLSLIIGEEDFPARLNGDQLLLFPAAGALGAGEGTVRLAGSVRDGTVDGSGSWPDGTSFSWQATRIGGPEDAASDDDEEAAEAVPALVAQPWPAGAFGRLGLPSAPASVLVRNATIWTSAAAGRLENADLLVRNGRIEAVGVGIEPPRGALVIDGTGKHVTAGLIDAHSHTAISRGVNEIGSAITLEVRIADVLNPTDIGIYRELAGGLTAANVMHGSANPMGGQTQTVKWRWGGAADDLVFDGAPPGVKFALGENVKQSNWGDGFTTRYPQSRMGVEQIIRDTFNAAARYRERSESVRRGQPLRRDIRLDAALEILDRQRVVHVHSYRQDEILAFIRIAAEYGVRVAAFQHVLEGYKVAPEIASIGAGGSTFSDWWAYKFEVHDAIPYNGALMHEAGVVTSFNSDDDELATRLNTEAAKAVKYGGLTEEAALDFVTINPAMQLGIDDRVGSLESGKDADFVIWNGHPLSTFTRAEQTWIDGRRYFDIDEDAAMRERIAAERARLVQEALADTIVSGQTPEGGGQRPTARNSDIYDGLAARSHARSEANE